MDKNSEYNKSFEIFEKNGNALIRAIFESSAEGILIVNKDGQIIMANSQSEKMFGYTPGELPGRSVDDLVPSVLRKHHSGHRKRFHQTPTQRPMGSGRDFPAQRKDGSFFSVEISLNHANLEGEMFVMAFITDITERKKFEYQVLKNKELLWYFVKHTPAAVAMLDHKLRYLVVSSRWVEDYELSSDIIGHYHSEYFPDFEEKWEPHFKKCLEGEIVTGDEDEIRYAGDKRTWIRWEAHPWREDNGHIGGLIMFSENITERKRSQDALRKSETKLKQYTRELERSNRELQDFAYISSHDLQEPLRKIRAFGDRISQKEKENLSPRGQDYLDRMQNSAERMQKLINDLLAFSRVSSRAKPFKRLNLSTILNDVLSDLEILIEKTNAIIEVSDLPYWEGDDTQLRQLFQNLISNAIKFRKADLDPKIIISHQLIREGGMERLEISVEDNGIGFDEKHNEKIFQIFQRLEGRKYEGSGIGLAICKRIAQRHGGDIKACSELGKGSRFVITLEQISSDNKD
ncbi:sensor histidine kinase [Sediminitomix flava]|uniref:histidine kinase n=1 Tax=Sediminitomix flava TaxID=379075 RepID=A0A315YVX2_SEDFL|nr:PAS domain S-box protein [Sediminitomix flava]PWJ33682.1 PAS domain S-box-containing protein [Sediminitomix flava]